jgi:hypothetical protein
MVIVDTVAIANGVTKAIDDYRNSPEDFVADYVAPVVPVNVKQGSMPRFGRMNQKLINFKVDAFAPSPRVDYDLSTTDYNCVVSRGAANLPAELKEFDDTKLLDAANLGIKVDEALRIEREYELATFMTNAANFTNDSDPATAWNAAGGDPAGDMSTGQTAINTAINRWGQYGLCTFDVALFLRAFVADLRGGGGSVAMAPLDEVAAYLGLKELRIAGAGYDSAAPGLDSVAARLFGTENFWLFYKPEQLNQYSPSFMATARYAPLSRARVWTVDDPEGIMVESRDAYDLVCVDETAAYYFHGVLS